MIRVPQHIKRKYLTKEFEAVDRCERNFDVSLGNPDLELEVGDAITISEIDSKTNEPTGRELTRKVGSKLSTKALELDPKDISKYGIDVLGLVNPQYRTLKSVFDHSCIMSR